MSFLPDSGDINLLFQPTKQIYSKVEILNSDFNIVKSIEGRLISDNFNNDANSNIRRTYSCSLQVTDEFVKFDRNEDFWFDRYIRPYVGIYSILRREIVWYLKGTFCSANATHTFNEETNTLQLSCNDMMCRLTGDLDGKQAGLSFTIPVGENIRESIIGIISVFGFTKYNIPELPRDVQYDLEFNAGATAYDMISELMQFAPNYEFFFDLDGTFIVQRIPCYTNDPKLMSKDIFNKLLVSQDSYVVNFTAKNCIEVWGKQYDEESVDRYTDEVTYSGNTYSIRFSNLKTPVYVASFTTTVPSSLHPDLKRALFIAQIKDSTGTFTATYNATNKIWHIVGGLIDEEVSERDARKIWGFVYDAPPSSGATYTISVTTTKKIRNYLLFGIEDPAVNQDGFNIKFINEQTEGSTTVTETLGPFTVVDDYERPIKAGTLDSENAFLFMFNRDENTDQEKIYYLGHLTPTAQYKNVDPNSSFSIQNMGREYWEIFSDGEYANITSDLLAMERAMYECFYKANLNETLSLTLLDVPWLDVNKKIEFQRPKSDKSQMWLIQSISSETLAGTCQVNLVPFYPDWSEVFDSITI